MSVHGVWQRDRFRNHLCWAEIKKEIVRNYVFICCFIFDFTSGVTECAADLSPKGSICFVVSWNGSELPKASLKPPGFWLKPESKPEDLESSPNESLAKPFELNLSADEVSYKIYVIINMSIIHIIAKLASLTSKVCFAFLKSGSRLS